MTTSLSDRAGFLIVANLIKYAVGFIMPMVLVRLLSQNDYGSYQQMILMGTAATGILTLGLPTSIYYFYHFVGQQQIPALIVQTTMLLVVAGILAALVVVFGADHFSAMLNNPSMTKLLQLYAMSLVFMIGSEHCLHFMIAQNRYGLAVAFEIAETFVRVLTLLAPLYWGYGFTGLIAGIVAYSVLRFVIRNGFLFGRSGVAFTGWTRQTFVSEQLAYSIPVALVSLSALVASTLSRGMLAASFTPADYAVYAVGAIEIPLDVIFQASVANVLRASLPPLVRDGNLDEVVRIIREAIRKLAIIVLPSFIFLLGHSYAFITLLFTSNYQESVHVFRIYLWLVPLHMLVMSVIPQVFGKPNLNLYIVVVMSGVLLLLSYALLKTVGLYGPAFASVITQYIQVAAYLIIGLRLTKSTFRRWFPIRHILQVILAATISHLASTLVEQVTSSGIVNLLLAGVVFSVTFFVAATALRIFSNEDVRLIKRWIAKFARLKLA